MASISLLKLVMSYRKAKVDLFYSSDPRRMDLVDYEENLSANLAELLRRIEGADEQWVSAAEFVGGFTFAPKKLSEPPGGQKSFWSVPAESWRNLTGGTVPAAEFRLMSRCSIDMHVFSTLWMLEVGTSLDARLKDNAMGSRLRRSRAGESNQLGSGTFLPYQSGYQRWRDGGLEAMTAALKADKDVIALTADVSSFYHQLDPIFIQDPTFLSEVLGVNLNPEQEKLTRLFLSAIRAWSSSVAVQTGWRDRGLPVGLPASAVIANLALSELDSVVLENIHPLYYGRYVDDLLLVVQDPGSIPNQDALWDWLIAQSRNLLTRELPNLAPQEADSLGGTTYFAPSYLQRSVVAFENRKNKSFHLSGRSGMALIESIRATIQSRSSEWRLLANVPSEVDQIEPAIASVRQIDGEGAATLRDADRISARKQSFSVKLRDFESFERNLPPEAWEAQRQEFFRVTCEQILSLPTFFDLAVYVPRLVILAAACHDSRSLVAIFTALAQLPNELRETCRVKVAAFYPGDETVVRGAGFDGPVASLVLRNWTATLIGIAAESLISGWRENVSSAVLREILEPLRLGGSEQIRPLLGVASLRSQHGRMAQRDLAHRPYRWSLLDLPNAETIRPVERASLPIDLTLEAGLDLLVAELRRGRRRPRRDLGLRGSANAGLAFATRPPSAMELFLALPASHVNRHGVAANTVVGAVMKAMRGTFSDPPVEVNVRAGRPTEIRVATRRRVQRVRVALTMLDTDAGDAAKAADGIPNLTLDRLNHLRDLLNSVALHRDRPDYLLLPELAMPARWFPEFARGLRRSGISLIAGIEYQAHGRKAVSNQVWAALSLDGVGLPFFVYRQDKQRPAKPEVEKLLGPLGKSLKPLNRWKLPPVVEHQEFRLALLICSELTNIDYRAHLRGAVDALFIPEWNQDLHSFEALVESSALDLHSYIAQANTRGFGDTRLRAPMANDWERDVVRLKGGSHDYFVVGQIDFRKLRAYQLSGDPTPIPAEETPKLEKRSYKPLPDGFKMDPRRA